MCLRFSSALLPRFAQKHVQHPSRVSAKVSVLYYNPFDFHRTHTHRLHKRPRPSRLYTAVAACTSTHISNAINERMNAGTHCNFCHAFFLSFFHCLAYSFVAVAVLCVIFLGANMMHSLQCVMKWWDRQQFFSHSVLLMFLDHVSFSAAAADSARQQCCMQPNWKLTHRGNQWDRKKLFFHSYE